MDNQHRHIAGYRELTAEDIALMNKIKAHGAALQDLVEDLRAPKSADPLRPRELDQRWVSIGATHLQEGLMALTRAVAQPTTF